MITLETGLPGSGKTLYCVDKLLRPLVGTSITDEHRDVHPRTIFTNINGLCLPHEKIDGTHLATWHEWAKPGSVLVFDEVQKCWPKSTVGSKVPPAIEGLETHRHMGVDFILLTQHPELIHTNVTRLVGRHLHIRRLGNMGITTVYEWDGCSRNLSYKACMSKGPFRYKKDVFQLYKSSSLHTKQPRRIPSLVFGIGFAIAALAYLGPTVASRVSDRITPKPLVAASASKAPASAPAPSRLAASTPAAPGPVAPPAAVAAAPAFAGCMRIAEQCRCLDARGSLVSVEPAQCLSVSGFGRGAPVDIGQDTMRPVDLAQASGDVDTLRWMASQRKAR